MSHAGLISSLIMYPSCHHQIPAFPFHHCTKVSILIKAGSLCILHGSVLYQSRLHVVTFFLCCSKHSIYEAAHFCMNNSNAMKSMLRCHFQGTFTLWEIHYDLGAFLYIMISPLAVWIDFDFSVSLFCLFPPLLLFLGSTGPYSPARMPHRGMLSMFQKLSMFPIYPHLSCINYDNVFWCCQLFATSLFIRIFLISLFWKCSM